MYNKLAMLSTLRTPVAEDPYGTSRTPEVLCSRGATQTARRARGTDGSLASPRSRPPRRVRRRCLGAARALFSNSLQPQAKELRGSSEAKLTRGLRQLQSN